VNVNFAIPRAQPGVIVPDAALVFNAGGLQVATVDQQDIVHFHKVSIYRDFGTTAELHDGLEGGESLILTPPAGLEEGSKVQIINPDAGHGDTARQTASR
jgi:HlyD family secretion protein